MPQRQAVDGTLSVDNASFAPPCDRQRLVAKMLLSHDMRYTATGITERDDRCGTRPSGELSSPALAAAATASEISSTLTAMHVEFNQISKYSFIIVLYHGPGVARGAQWATLRKVAIRKVAIRLQDVPSRILVRTADRDI